MGENYSLVQKEKDMQYLPQRVLGLSKHFEQTSFKGSQLRSEHFHFLTVVENSEENSENSDENLGRNQRMLEV